MYFVNQQPLLYKKKNSLPHKPNVKGVKIIFENSGISNQKLISFFLN